jgi:hypothetical protein
MLPTKFLFIWPSGFRGEDFLELTLSETSIACGGHVFGQMNRNFVGSIYVRSFINIALSSQSQSVNKHGHHRQFLFLIGQLLKKCSPLKAHGQMNGNLPCFLTYHDVMSNRYRGSTIYYASYQISVHLAKRFQRRRFLEINRSETRIACGGHVC